MTRGAAVTHHNTIYCISRSTDKAYCNTIYRYRLDEDEWQEHSQCPHSDPGLVIINDLLTAVGGREGSRKTNKLVTWKDGKWVEEFPPMNTARFEHAVVCDGRYVIAAGGGDDETSVELFTISSNTWSPLTSLPQPAVLTTLTLCGHSLYHMHHGGQAYSMDLSDLTTGASSQLSHSQSRWLPFSQKAPVQFATLATVNDTVLAVGGARGFTPTNDVHAAHNGEWVKIGHMRSTRLCSIVAVLPGYSIVVVGGYSAGTDVESGVPH